MGQGESAIDGLENGYLDGALNKTAFAVAVARILALWASLPG